jgi:hypothetical protein
VSASSWWSIAALFLTSASAFIALLKEKREKRGKRWHRNVLLAFTALGLVVGVFLIRQTSKDASASDQQHQRERQKDVEQIAGLTQSIETQTKNNELQYLRNRDEVHRLQDQLTDLQKQVATEELRKKMDALRVQLDKALAPTPRARLQTGFWMEGIGDELRTETYAPADENVVAFSVIVQNVSDVNAKGVNLWLRICGACKFHTEPAGFAHVAGAPDVERLYKFGDLPAGVRSQKMSIEVEVPESITKIAVGTKYRCDNCEIEKDFQQMWVTIGRIPFPKIAPPKQR